MVTFPVCSRRLPFSHTVQTPPFVNLELSPAPSNSLEEGPCGPPLPAPTEDYADTSTLPDNFSEVTTGSVSLSTLDEDITHISSEAQVDNYLGDNLDPACLMLPTTSSTSGPQPCTPPNLPRGDDWPRHNNWHVWPWSHLWHSPGFLLHHLNVVKSSRLMVRCQSQWWLPHPPPLLLQLLLGGGMCTPLSSLLFVAMGRLQPGTTLHPCHLLLTVFILVRFPLICLQFPICICQLTLQNFFWTRLRLFTGSPLHIHWVGSSVFNCCMSTCRNLPGTPGT